MQIKKITLLTFLLALSTLFQGCARDSDTVWDDTKTAGRHIQNGFCSLVGRGGVSRQIGSKQEFEYYEESPYSDSGSYQGYDYQSADSCSYEPEFVPIDDECGDLAMNDRFCRPSRISPGEPGSPIPGIESFRDPSTIAELSGVFRPIYFEYNSDLIRGNQNLQTVQSIAQYMRLHPNLFIFVEGHTDERGPQAYNLALGSRRANEVRQFLVSEGVNPDRVLTISYGKERPVILEQHEEGWSKNRRAEFKVYFAR